MKSIFDNRGEDHEILLIIIACCSLITFRKIARLERYKNKLKGQFKPYRDLFLNRKNTKKPAVEPAFPYESVSICMPVCAFT